ncbi:MAG: class I SAM-dependent methyltransferase [Candidatus Thiodiazotropha sp.]
MVYAFFRFDQEYGRVDDLIIPEYRELQQQLGLMQGLPFTPLWSAEADFVRLIVDACLEQRPSLILECSSGLTTLMLARCCQLNGHGRVVSLEDGEPYALRTREYISRYALDDYASVLHAPLQPAQYDGVEYAWYDTGCFPEVTIDMLVIDGPSGFSGKNARYPALPVCYPFLSPGCRIFLDDAARPDEREIVALWQANYPGLSHRFHETARGCSLLTLDTVQDADSRPQEAL